MNKNIIVKLQKNTTTKKKKQELNDRFKSVDGACIENAVTSMRRWKDAVRKGSYKIRCYFALSSSNPLFESRFVLSFCTLKFNLIYKFEKLEKTQIYNKSVLLIQCVQKRR